jgi:glutamate-1-semialdehyde 2,1-aminomutase
MRHFDPALEGTAEFVQQAGTLNGNPIAAAAGLATLAELRKPGAYERLHALGRRLKDGLASAAARHGLPAQVSGEPPVFDILFTDRPVTDYRATLTADRDRIRVFNEECVRRGLVKAVNKIYVSLAHTDADIDEALGIFDAALGAVAERTGGRR